MNVRNEIKAQIIRAGMTMQEVVDLLSDEYGWSDSVSNLSAKLQRERQVAYLFICHDLALANTFCDKIIVMQKGKVVETIRDLTLAKDPYTKKLLASIFTIEEGKNKVLPDELFA